jgi:signal transduction histidine kinase
MSSKRGPSFLRTATLRLALWHAGLFAILSLATFALVYLTLQASLIQQTDRELNEDAQEAESKLQGVSRREGEAAFRADVDPIDVDKDVRVLLSSGLKVRTSSDLTSWSGIDFVPHDAGRIAPGEAVLRTVFVPGLQHQARILVRRARDGSLIEIGTSLADSEDLLRIVRRIFALGWITTIIPGLLLGWFMARRAMAGVDRVTATAVQIGKSDLSQRVPVGREGEEIENLARAFNEMLDRIHLLIRELQDVSSNIAHDLKSPITRIRVLAETHLRAGTGVPQSDHMAGPIIEECDRLVGMIDTILEIAATDAGVAPLGDSVIDLADVARDAVDLLQPAADENGIRLECNLPPAPLLIRGDLNRVQRVVGNLLDNAIKYTKRGGAVRVSAETTPDRISLSITDSGIGIDSETLPRVFERFYRGEWSRSTPGHGLGLSLARSIARAYGGEIAVESGFGKGSVFTIHWPSSRSKSPVL